jgi:hypothetical protein
LINRLKFVEFTKSKEIGQLPLRPPVVITGLSRSGTTFLHRLLSLNRDFYAVPLWELFSPFKKPGPIDMRRMITGVKIRIKNILLPELDKIHFTRTNNTEECIMLLANSFNSQLFTDIAPLPGYLDWLICADRNYAYNEYRDQLKVLQSFHPDKRLVLKAPNHLGNLIELLSFIPFAIVIQMHRTPEKCCSSLISLRKTLYKIVVSDINVKEIQTLALKLFDNEINRNLEFHESFPDRVISLSYDTLISDPLAALHEIYERASLTWTEEIEESSKKYIHLNPKNKRGIHEYRHLIDKEKIPKSFMYYKSYFSQYL